MAAPRKLLGLLMTDAHDFNAQRGRYDIHFWIRGSSHLIYKRSLMTDWQCETCSARNGSRASGAYSNA